MYKIYKKIFSSFFYKKRIRKIIILIANFFCKNKIKKFDKFLLKLNTHEITALKIYFGSYEKKIVNFIKKETIDGNNFVDIGSNLGFYTMLFSSLSPNGKVYSFEPEKKNFLKLKKNIKLNKFTNICAFNIGLSNKSGTANLALTNEINNEGGHYITDKNTNNNILFKKIKIKKLDQILKKKKFYKIIKIDVEGHEINVLKGMKRILSGEVKYLIIETGNQFKIIKGLLQKYNFELYMKYNINSIFIKKLYKNKNF